MPPYVLVVESDPDLQQRIGSTLGEASYELSAETEAAWARRSLLVRPPDAVVVDTSLTDGSGFSVAIAIRKEADTRKIPIFFVASKFSGASHSSEARRRFAPAHYFSTPLDLDSLLAAVLETVPPRPADPHASVPDYPVPPPPVAALTDATQRRERREVEQAARHLSVRDGDTRGSLTRQPFARLLQRFYAQRRTGSLLLVREAIKKIVYFREGYPVSVRSNVLVECLGQILLSEKLISKGALDESLRRMEQEKKQQGSLLVEMGALSPYNLSRALVSQMEAKLYELFSWRSGTFTFTDGDEPAGEPVRLEKTPASLILEGIRRHYDALRLAAALEPLLGHYVVPSRDPLKRLQGITRDAAELRFIDSIDGTKRLESLLGSTSITTDRARLLLAAMSEAGMVEPARTAAKRVADEAKQRREGTGEHPLGRSADQKTVEELTAVLETMRRQTHFIALGTTTTADAGEVDQAYEQLAREYHPDRFRARTDDVRGVALKIFDRLGEAQTTLRDAGRRRKYLQQLDRERAGREDETAPVAVQEASSAAAEQVYYTGVEHLRARRYREAVEAFRQATLLSPGQASYHGALGWALFRAAPADIAAIDAGQAALRHAIGLDPDSPWVRVSLGRFFAETGRPDQAIGEFEMALGLNPGLTDIEEEIRRLRGQT